MSIKSPHDSYSIFLFVFTWFSFKSPHKNQYIPKRSCQWKVHIFETLLSSLLIRIRVSIRGVESLGGHFAWSKKNPSLLGCHAHHNYDNKCDLCQDILVISFSILWNIYRYERKWTVVEVAEIIMLVTEAKKLAIRDSSMILAEIWINLV